MGDLQASDFPAFFEALYEFEPFPWQRMLVERVAENGWPEGIDLPTASGKTACIDAAVFLLALGEQNGRLSLDHPARRRIFFVVDRRIVVDEAFERAQRLACKLQNASNGVVKEVAERLRALAGSESSEPLVASRLRGGTVKDEYWRLSPAQPAIITSTVDQVGSRLLFRSYGSSNLAAPIDAALTACDSLILLDEAHCAVPFMQTARAVKRYAGEKWIEDQPVVSPLTSSILSATLPEDVQDVFPMLHARDASLDAPELRQRMEARKSAELAKARKPGRRDWTLGRASSDDELVLHAAQRAANLVQQGRQRVAVMVNRVATAAEIAEQLKQAVAAAEINLHAEVVLMTGRMRPIDRDCLVEKWSSYLKAGSKGQRDRPVILVTTQCLEVGADFSFDALITECASLDALRQRFGRLNRLGTFPNVDAVVLARKADIAAKADDPIYGTALKETWNWLNAQASELDGAKQFDFGIVNVEQALPINKAERGELLAKLNAPTLNAPVLLPAHVDLLCQTAPQPAPDPDVAIYLHGPEHGVPEARVVFRADLAATDKDDWRNKWKDAVALLPPLTAEALTLPLWLVRKWLGKESVQDAADEISDVESQRVSEHYARASRGQPFVIWRGLQESSVSRRPEDVKPNETVVVPADPDLADRLSHAFCRPEDAPLDVAEQAYPAGRDQHILRLVPSVLSDWASHEPVRSLLNWAKNEERNISELSDVMRDVGNQEADGGDESGTLPSWLTGVASTFHGKNYRIVPHPTQGVVLLEKSTKNDAVLNLDFGDTDDMLSAADRSVSLRDHTDHVAVRTAAWANRCLPESFQDTLRMAAELHDLGKADSRFQILLHGDEVDAAVKLANGELLAKSNGLFRSPAKNRQIRAVARLPDHFRHEMLSMQLAERSNELPDDESPRELALHLIAAHHGHARPFAPVVIDEELPGMTVDGIDLDDAARRELIPPHRLDSGVAERFWTLTRRYGWWGLAYLEAVLRLADHHASAAEAAMQSPSQQEVIQ